MYQTEASQMDSTCKRKKDKKKNTTTTATTTKKKQTQQQQQLQIRSQRKQTKEIEACKV